MIFQKEITLRGFSRGFHLITRLIEDNIENLPEKGLLNVLVKHTTAALAINENADPSVRVDFRSFVDKLIPDQNSIYTHTLEGPDDMSSHLKSALFGQSLTIPVTNHRLNLGIWQGIYFCEFRNSGGPRNLVLTVFG
jgi:secondary thiamine-phosphate synthase enzyme